MWAAVQSAATEQSSSSSKGFYRQLLIVKLCGLISLPCGRDHIFIMQHWCCTTGLKGAVPYPDRTHFCTACHIYSLSIQLAHTLLHYKEDGNLDHWNSTWTETFPKLSSEETHISYLESKIIRLYNYTLFSFCLLIIWLINQWIDRTF